MNTEELKKEIEMNSYTENPNSLTRVIDVDTVLELIDEYLDKQLILHPVILSDQQKKEEYDKGFCDGYNAGCEQIMDSSI